MLLSEMTAVDSSTISHIHHNPATGVCTVRFHNGGNPYAYSPMDSSQYKAFLTGDGFKPPSVGKHFTQFIRNNPHYKVTPLGSADQEEKKADGDEEMAVA